MPKLSRFVLKALRLPLRVVDNFRTIGVRRAVAIYGERIAEEVRERRLGINTQGDVPGRELSSDPACHCYQVVNYSSLDSVFGYLSIDPIHDVFLDYGCGKGRAVVVAATHSFRRVIGIDFAPSLADIARTNLRRAERHLRCRDVEIVTENAMNYIVPEDVNVLFLFNPFSEHVMDAVLERIRDSLATARREISIFYLQPRDEPNVLAKCDWLYWDCDLPTGTWDQVQLHCYRTTS